MTSLALTHLERGFHFSGRPDLHVTQSAQLDLTKGHQAGTRALAHCAAQPKQHRQASENISISSSIPSERLQGGKEGWGGITQAAKAAALLGASSSTHCASDVRAGLGSGREL